MIKAHLRNTITCLVSEYSSIQWKSRFCLSRSVLYFSSASESKPLLEFLVHKHKFSLKVASHIVSFSSTFTFNPEKSDATLSYFEEIGFTKAQLERTIRLRPKLLASDVDNILKPKVKVFQDWGFSLKDIAAIVSRQPAILHSSAEKKVVPSLLLLSEMLGSNKGVAKALKQSGWLLMIDLENTMVPVVQFLKSCGLSTKQINVLIKSRPRFLYKLKDVKKCVEKVGQMGIDGNSKVFMDAVVVVGSLSNAWELKVQAFRDILKFNEDDIQRVFSSTPRVFLVSEDKMKTVKEILLATGKYELSCIVKHPLSLMHSIKKRYNPRLQALAILERRNSIVQWPSLSSLYSRTDAEFYHQYIWPSLDDPVIAAWHKDNPMIKGVNPNQLPEKHVSTQQKFISRLFALVGINRV